MRIALYLLIIASFSSCKQWVQLYRTKPINVAVKDDTYVYENDTLRITYEFWTERGIMAYTITNKLNIPIYVDWKKCSYIKNGKKLNYWFDTETVNTETDYRAYTYTGNYFRPFLSLVHGGRVITYGTPFSVSATAGKGYSTSVKTKAERITFIAPHSEISLTQFHLYSSGGTLLDIERPMIEVKRSDDTTKLTKVYYATYDLDDSPLNFRNFLTFSTTENFSGEFYIDNGFYVSKISEMDRRHFLSKDNSDPTQPAYYSYPFADSRYFYINIARPNSLHFRKSKPLL